MSEKPSKHKNQHIKVIVRIRPLTKKEINSNTKAIINCMTAQEIATKEKRYTFDRVFKPDSTQLDIYKASVAPMISDVISGYNCTVFAYGQTGTGKTYTMTGTTSGVSDWDQDSSVGCIPRAANNIFDELFKLSLSLEFTVRVSYLELYNEEVRDLLNENDHLPPLMIYNDPNNKGSVCVQNLKEETVCNKTDIYAVLDRGTLRRQTAPTLMNHQSSRSHTIFTISVYTRKSQAEGQDIITTGKLNLVDLAGSENAAKSGSKEKRAVEMANINKSLLTLGRVIHALVEKKTHIPYRDSKLTRILQDSLGGKTKTCIIATVSPGGNSYEESVSTIEYAIRAKNITNCPTLNEIKTKGNLIKNLNEKIKKLNRDLEAARAGKGFYVDEQNYQQMVEDITKFKGEVLSTSESIAKFEASIADLQKNKITLEQQNEELNASFEKTRLELERNKLLIKEKKKALAEQQNLNRDLEEREAKLYKEATKFLEVNEKFAQSEEIFHKKVKKLYEISTHHTYFSTVTLPNCDKILDQMESEKLKFTNMAHNQNTKFKESIITSKNNLNAVKKTIDSYKSYVKDMVDALDPDEGNKSLLPHIENHIKYLEEYRATQLDRLAAFKKSSEEVTAVKQITNQMGDLVQYVDTEKTLSSKFEDQNVSKRIAALDKDTKEIQLRKTQIEEELKYITKKYLANIKLKEMRIQRNETLKESIKNKVQEINLNVVTEYSRSVSSEDCKVKEVTHDKLATLDAEVTEVRNFCSKQIERHLDEVSVTDTQDTKIMVDRLNHQLTKQKEDHINELITKINNFEQLVVEVENTEDSLQANTDYFNQSIKQYPETLSKNISMIKTDIIAECSKGIKPLKPEGNTPARMAIRKPRHLPRRSSQDFLIKKVKEYCREVPIKEETETSSVDKKFESIICLDDSSVICLDDSEDKENSAISLNSPSEDT